MQYWVRKFKSFILQTILLKGNMKKTQFLIYTKKSQIIVSDKNKVWPFFDNDNTCKVWKRVDTFINQFSKYPLSYFIKFTTIYRKLQYFLLIYRVFMNNVYGNWTHITIFPYFISRIIRSACYIVHFFE